MINYSAEITYINKDYHTLIDFLLCNQQKGRETRKEEGLGGRRGVERRKEEGLGGRKR